MRIEEDEKSLLCYEQLSIASNFTTEPSDISKENYDEAILYCDEHLPMHSPTSINQTIPMVGDDIKIKRSFSDIVSPAKNSNKNRLHPMHLLTTALAIVEKSAFRKTEEAGSDEEQKVADLSDSSSLSEQSTSLVSCPGMISWQHYRSESHTSDLQRVEKQDFAAKMRFFPEKLFSMITETSKSDPDVMRWVFDGEAFIISEKSPRLSLILREYFYHGKYSSLQRQLNMYGFNKSTYGKYEGTFRHPSFHRDISCRSQLAVIERKCRPQRCQSQKNTSQSRWDEMFDSLRMYQKTHGNCHIYKSDLQLDRWVVKQRHLYKDMKEGQCTALSLGRIQRLNSIGFIWNTVCSNKHEY